MTIYYSGRVAYIDNMNTYKITMIVNDSEVSEKWSGYDEQVAISQAFLHHAQNGARKLEVISIEGL